MLTSSLPKFLGGFSKSLRLTIQAFEPKTEKCIRVMFGQTTDLYRFDMGHG